MICTDWPSGRPDGHDCATLADLDAGVSATYGSARWQQHRAAQGAADL